MTKAQRIANEKAHSYLLAHGWSNTAEGAEYQIQLGTDNKRTAGISAMRLYKPAGDRGWVQHLYVNGIILFEQSYPSLHAFVKTIW